jgi:pyruvate kinase
MTTLYEYEFIMTPRRTKIVCTIGPASESEAMLSKLTDAGMNVARLNFSHGAHEDHWQRIQTLRRLADEKNVPIAILQDLSGPKIRTGPMPEPALLREGETFILTARKITGTAQEVGITYADLPKEVEAGDTILLADGSIELKVLESTDDDIRCRVIVGGMLDSNKGINLPGRSLNISGLTEKDRSDLIFGLQAGVDYVALSFVRNVADLRTVHEIMKSHGQKVPVIAKIEKHEALQDIDRIIEIADGIMVARGDLAVETALERVPLVQKMLIEKCNFAGKPVITATQMLKSMVESPRPTRAEAADVANAVLDGTDAVMLSEETAIGKYPERTAQVMDTIIRTTEEHVGWRDIQTQSDKGRITITAAVSHATVNMARDLGARAILTPTRSGSTARMVARYRPSVPILGLSSNPLTVRQLALVWGVVPLLIDESINSYEVIERAKQAALEAGFVQRGDTVVITAGLPPSAYSATNLIKAEVIS